MTMIVANTKPLAREKPCFMKLENYKEILFTPSFRAMQKEPLGFRLERPAQTPEFLATHPERLQSALELFETMTAEGIADNKRLDRTKDLTDAFMSTTITKLPHYES